MNNFLILGNIYMYILWTFIIVHLTVYFLNTLPAFLKAVIRALCIILLLFPVDNGIIHGSLRRGTHWCHSWDLHGCLGIDSLCQVSNGANTWWEWKTSAIKTLVSSEVDWLEQLDEADANMACAVKPTPIATMGCMIGDLPQQDIGVQQAFLVPASHWWSTRCIPGHRQSVSQFPLSFPDWGSVPHLARPGSPWNPPMAKPHEHHRQISNIFILMY